eukprot:192203_1
MTDTTQEQKVKEEIRANWKKGSLVEVFSSSSQTWYKGEIVRIFTDDEGEWLEVSYSPGTTKRQKQIPRDDKDSIRPTIDEVIKKIKVLRNKNKSVGTRVIGENEKKARGTADVISKQRDEFYEKAKQKKDKTFSRAKKKFDYVTTNAKQQYEWSVEAIEEAYQNAINKINSECDAELVALEK